MKNRLKVAWAEILTRNPETKEMGTLIGNIREVHDNYSEVEISKWNGEAEEIVTRSIPNCFLSNIDE